MAAMVDSNVSTGVSVVGASLAPNAVAAPRSPASTTAMTPAPTPMQTPITTSGNTISAGAPVPPAPTLQRISKEDLQTLESFTSLRSGLIELKTPLDVEHQHLIFKGISFLESVLGAFVDLVKKDLEPDETIDDTRIVQTIKLEGGFDSRVALYLGHFNLLMEDYHKALSAYQLYFRIESESYWNDSQFLYGLAIVYFHFGAHKWAVRLFQTILYFDPSFTRIREVHYRLGILFKFLDDFESSMKHFRLAISQGGQRRTFSEIEVQFHIGHLLETQDKPKAAKDAYEGLLSALGKVVSPSAPLPSLAETVKSNALRHLGWLFQTNDVLNPQQAHQPLPNPMEPPVDPRTQRTAAAIDCLRESIRTDENSGQSWYFLGRCYASLGKVHDAFVAYRHSIDKSEASADTWCSIGVLYQQQNQPMDALQAYICAVQLDKSHVAAWTDLAVLYESCGQPRDALTCYINAANSTMAPPEFPGSAFRSGRRFGGSGATGVIQRHFNSAPPSEALRQRIKFLQTELNKVKALIHSHPNKVKTLPSIEEAWTLPIPAELTSRQQQLAQQQQQEQLFQRDEFNKGLVLMNDEPDGPMGAKRRRLNGDPGVGGGEMGTASQSAAMFRILHQNRETLNERQREILKKLEARREKAASIMGHPPPMGPNSAPIMGLRPNPHLIGLQPRPPPPPYPGPPCSLNAELTPTIAAAVPSVVNGDVPPTTCTDTKPIVTSKTENISEPYLAPSANFRLPWPKQRKRKPSEFDAKDSASIIVNEAKQLASKETDAARKTRVWLTQSPIGAPPNEPPTPFPPLPRDKLTPAVQTIPLTSKKDANSPGLQGICASQPLTILKGLASALKLDLGLFSTKRLVEQNPPQSIEIRTQRKQKSDDNFDATGRFRVWRCDSERSKSNIAKYAKYQAASFQESLLEEANGAGSDVKDDFESPGFLGKRSKRRHDDKPFKVIKTGRCDIVPNDKKWRLQLAELQKVPQFLRVISASNILSHLGQNAMGVNAIRLHLTVPGSRNTAHQEENNLCYVNLNIGPGELEWFAVEEKFWGALRSLCEKHNVNYLTGPWWPVLEELIDNDIPVYRFQQSPGDLVWVNSGTIFWVQSIGWCNSISWNLGTLAFSQYSLAIERYEYNKLMSVKSKLPMMTLSWNLASNLRISEKKLWEHIRLVLRRTLHQYALTLEYLRGVKGVQAETELFKSCNTSILFDLCNPFCAFCEVEIFNVFFAREDHKKPKYSLFCIDCASRFPSGDKFDDFILFHQFTLDHLTEVYDNFTLNVTSSMMPPPMAPVSPSMSHMAVGTMTPPIGSNYPHSSINPGPHGSNTFSSQMSSSMELPSKVRGSLQQTALPHGPGGAPSLSPTNIKPNLTGFPSNAFHHNLKSSLASQSLRESLVQQTLKSAISNSPSLSMIKQGLNSGNVSTGASPSNPNQQNVKSGLPSANQGVGFQPNVKTDLTATSKVGSLSTSMSMLSTESKLHNHNPSKTVE